MRVDNAWWVGGAWGEEVGWQVGILGLRGKGAPVGVGGCLVSYKGGW